MAEFLDQNKNNGFSENLAKIKVGARGNPGSVFARQLMGISHGLSVIIIAVFAEIKNKYLDLDMELESIIC